MLGFFMLNIAGIFLQCLFPLTNRPVCDAGRAGKVELLSTFTLAAAQLLQYRRDMFPYSVKFPCQDPGNNRRQYAGSLRLYGIQP